MEPMKGVVYALMSKLEKDKHGLELNPAEDGAYCEAFAVNIFNRANRVDRAGQANDSTAKTFYVASIFVDVSLISASPCWIVHWASWLAHYAAWLSNSKQVH